MAIRLAICACVFAATTGCAPLLRQPVAQPVANPIFVRANNYEVVWERAVDVLHDYHFRIVRENRLAHVIETDYLTGASVLEPWHHDSVGLENRLESTFQSIRRKVLVSVTPDESGAGYLVGVEVLKELEDVAGATANSAGGASFQEYTPLRRDLSGVVGQTAPSGWIPVGRDLALEADLMQSLRIAFSQ